MKFLQLDKYDGMFCTNELTEHQAMAYSRSMVVVEVEDSVYAAWQRYLDDAAVWNRLWTTLSNEAARELEGRKDTSK